MLRDLPEGPGHVDGAGSRAGGGLIDDPGFQASSSATDSHGESGVEARCRPGERDRARRRPRAALAPRVRRFVNLRPEAAYSVETTQAAIVQIVGPTTTPRFRVGGAVPAAAIELGVRWVGG